MKADQALLAKLHNAVAIELLERISTGEAKPADIQAAIKFLADNGVNAIPTASNGLGELAKKLPFLTTEQLADDAGMIN